MRRTLCLCSMIPRLETSTRVIVLMHVIERRSTTNTGRLANLALVNSELRLRGGIEGTMSEEGLVVDGRQSLLLYPTADAHELNSEFLRAHPGPYQLIVPDGTWAQAGKAARRQPSLAGVPRVRLKPGPPSRYRLRQAPSPECLSTLEAIAQALGVLEGEGIRKSLEDFLELMVERTLWSRGVLATNQCKHPIPRQAIEETIEAGRRSGLKRS